MRRQSLKISSLRYAPATKIILGVNIVIFIIQSLYVPGTSQTMATLFGLNYPSLMDGQVWRLVTHQFIHGNFLHLFVNMLALWFAGLAVEESVGTRRFLILYFIAGIVGGLVQVLSNLRPPYIDLIGASGAVCGIIMAFCTLFPRVQVRALIFFVIPVRLRARTLGIGIVVVSILFWILGWDKGVGHLAHLGGLGTGFIFGVWWLRSLQLVPQHTIPPPLPPEKEIYVSKDPEVDRILEKISQFGYDALTLSERQYLEDYSKRFLS